MLRELRISDLAIIEALEAGFEGGLSVLSGETGAGKSIILGALGLVLGARGSAELIRTGRDRAEVQARFDVDEQVLAVLTELDLPAPEEDDGLLLRRVLSRSGRSRAYVGPSAVPVAALRRLARVLVDYASQHEHQVLLDEASHTAVLDRFGDHGSLVAEVGAAVSELRALDAEIERLERAAQEQARREDYLRFQLQELDGASLVDGEWGELEVEQRALGDAVALAGRARRGEEALSGAAAGGLREALEATRALLELRPGLADTLQELEQALGSVEEAARGLQDVGRGLREDPARLGEVEARQRELRGLARKHRVDPEDLVAHSEALRREADELGVVEDRVRALVERREELRVACAERCAELRARRGRAGVGLSQRVQRELDSLGMAKARFAVELPPVAAGPDRVQLGTSGGYASSKGSERAVFHLSANVGEEPRPLARVASGGELSRILLSLRRALADASAVQVAVFDEIDSGIGGATAEVVGRKMADIARGGQVVCITHLPQLAAHADQHYRVEKSTVDGRTRTRLQQLSPDQRVAELVRMVAGTTDTDLGAAFARELLARAQGSTLGHGEARGADLWDNAELVRGDRNGSAR